MTTPIPTTTGKHKRKHKHDVTQSCHEYMLTKTLPGSPLFSNLYHDFVVSRSVTVFMGVDPYGTVGHSPIFGAGRL